jgi:hypothetical protein
VKEMFIQNSDSKLSKLIIDNYSDYIDDYANSPQFNLPRLDEFEGKQQLNIISVSCITEAVLLENNIFKVLSIGCKTSEFNNLIDCVSCIEEIRIDNFFYIHCIIIRDNKVRLRYIDVSLEVKIPGLMSVRTQRLRDKKINEILE